MEESPEPVRPIELSDRLEHLLTAASAGDETARARLWELVVDDLRVLARRRMSKEQRVQTELQATGLVNEVFVRLHGGSQLPAFENRDHFFGSVRRLMDQILCDRGRRRSRLRHGGGWERRSFDLVQGSLAMLDRWVDGDGDDIWSAFQRLHDLHHDAAEVAWQHLVLGRSLADIERTIDGIDVRSAWRFARASFLRDLAPVDEPVSVP